MERYRVGNIDCAVCAAKIESGVSQLECVSSSTLDFATQTLHLETSDLERVRSEIERIEPGVVLVALDTGADGGSMASSAAQLKAEAQQPLWRELGPAVVAFLLSLSLWFASASGVVALHWLLPLWVVAFLLSGWRVLRAAFANLLRGVFFDENSLMTIATLGAMAIGEYPEAVAVMLFYRLGEYLQERSVDSSRRSIRALTELRPDQVRLSESQQLVPAAAVAVGTLVTVAPGERVALDGVVASGSSRLDTSTLTGEPQPRLVEPGCEVMAGAVNGEGLLELRVTRPYGDSAVARIMRLVEDATARRAPTERFITRFARYYTPLVVVLAALVALLPPLLFADQLFSEWIYRALVLLVISCPCALVVSVPLSYFAAIGGASREGILFKGSNFIDIAARVRGVVFDKTGTLTTGEFAVRRFEWFGDLRSDIDGDAAANGPAAAERRRLARMLAALERPSSHPLARRLVDYLDSHFDDVEGGAAESVRAESMQELRGLGVVGRVEGCELRIGGRQLYGTAALSDDLRFDESQLPSDLQALYFEVDGELRARILLGDALRQEAAAVIEELRAIGVERMAIFSGDSESRVAAQAARLGLSRDQYRAGLLPDDKLAAIEELLNAERSGALLAVGDGVNDAPMLARADISVAMGGGGSDAAIESADVVVLHDRLELLPLLIRHARRSKSIVWQNIIFALGVKLLFVALSLAGLISMWEAVFADVGVTIIAVLNALRAMRVAK